MNRFDPIANTDYDFSVNKDSLYTLNSFYNQNIVTQLYQQIQQHDVYKNINKLKEYVKDSYRRKLVPDTTLLSRLCDSYLLSLDKVTCFLGAFTLQYIEKVKASTDMPIHSGKNNLSNGIFHLCCDVSDKAS
ncbi:hypothetical protein ACTFIW_000469 [Dictyostelium discoideum]